MKLVSYNIRYALGKDMRYDLERVAHAVAGADVIALQEVERFWPRSGMVDQPAALGAFLDAHYWVYGPAFDVDSSTRDEAGRIVNRRRQFGTMLMARTPILASRMHVLPKFATVAHLNMTMGALEGVIDTGAGPLRVYSLHRHHTSRRERLAQIEALLAIHRRATHEGGAMTGVKQMNFTFACLDGHLRHELAIGLTFEDRLHSIRL
jgi:endonuclease/exonuclease/phosphatase family metal-dependent hydrolase